MKRQVPALSVLKQCRARNDWLFGRVPALLHLQIVITHEVDEEQDDDLFEHYRIVVDPGQSLVRID